VSPPADVQQVMNSNVNDPIQFSELLVISGGMSGQAKFAYKTSNVSGGRIQALERWSAQDVIFTRNHGTTFVTFVAVILVTFIVFYSVYDADFN